MPTRSKHQRPRVKVHGAWAFGYTANVFIMDESARHDSSCILEILTQTIEDVPGRKLLFFNVSCMMHAHIHR